MASQMDTQPGCGETLERSPKKRSLGRLLLNYDKYLILIVFVFVSASLTEKFFTQVNICNILKQNSAVGIVALAELVVILTGGIDLSVGAIVSMCGIVTAVFLRQGCGWPEASALTILVGLAAGTANGLAVTAARITPFIVTLAGLVIYNGVGLLLSRGRQVFYQNPDFLYLGSAKFGCIPLMAIIWLILAGIMYLFLDKSVPGRYIRGIGGNKETVRLAGVNTGFYEMLAYSVSGVLCAVAGIMMSSRLTLGTNSVGQAWELTAIASVMIGGGSFVGGIGSVGGAIVGVIILGLIGNIMNLLGVSIFWQQIIRGLIILAAVFSSSRRTGS